MANSAHLLSRRRLLLALGLAGTASVGVYGIPRLREIFERGPSVPAATGTLTPAELALVAAMAEGIIPKTDTPGAVEAGVPEFIALLFSEWFSAAEQSTFRTGLLSFDTASRNRFGRDFAACTAEQRQMLLIEWDDAVAAARESHAASLPPFAQLKSLTVIGYYTSQVGQEQELHTVLDGGENEPGGAVMMPVPFTV